jgi:Na+/H+ antiporter NhaD/arsenite permease-like protein
MQLHHTLIVFALVTGACVSAAFDNTELAMVLAGAVAGYIAQDKGKPQQ